MSGGESRVVPLDFPLLSQISVAPGDRWVAACLVLVYAIVIVVLAPFARLQGPVLPVVVPIFTTAIVVCELATAFLVLEQLPQERSWSVLFIGCAYLFSSLMGVAHVLTFPDALVSDRPLIGGPQLTSYIYNVWRLGYAVLILFAMLAIGRSSPSRRAQWRTIRTVSVFAVVALAVAGAALGLALEPDLPPAIVGASFAPMGLVLSWLGVAVAVLALALLWIKTRCRSLLYLWLALALVAFCGDMFIGTIAGGRFTLGWYAGRSSGLLAGSALFMLFLIRFAGQQAQSAEVARQLRERGLSLQLEIARRVEAERRLLQSQKVEAMGQLTGGIAHDFNNLLAVIVGNLDLLRRRVGGDANAVRYVENALAAADRGTKLTSQLLVFSHSQRLELRAVIVADVIAGMRELLTRTLGPQIAISINLDTARIPVLSEPTQLELAMLNLAINARDAMPGGGTLTVTITPMRVNDDPELAPGEYVRLSVSDTGAGMAPEIAERAFEPFFTTKGIGQGTGLGLSQVFGIANRASGTARIESRPGAGTTVHLFMRRTDAAPANAETLSADRAIAPNPPAAIEVLVIDDNREVREFLCNYLSELGLSPSQADDGPSGLAHLERSRPDLLLVDFAMPGMNGAEVGKKARARYPNLPIVFVTGYADTGAIESAVGEDAVIVRKPFRTFELDAAIAEAVQRRR